LRRASHTIPLFRSRLAADGPYTTVDGVPLMAGVDYFGSLYTVVTATGPLGVSTGLQAVGDNTDAQAVRANGDLLVANRNYVFNGAAWDRLRSSSAANLEAQLSTGAMQRTRAGAWSIFATPAAGAGAIATRAAVPGAAHVCTSMVFTIGAINAQPITSFSLLDGATVIWQDKLGPFAAGTHSHIVQTNLNIIGSINTLMTVRNTSAISAGNFASVAMTGYDTV
jgi:hypothetical protein